MRKFNDHSRGISVVSTNSLSPRSDSRTTQNPFATPPASIHGGTTSGFGNSDGAGGKYFRSRRIRKEDGHEPPKFKKDPKEKFLWIIPLCGVLVGLAITGLLIYLQIGHVSSHNYCPVLDDDFSSGVLNPNIWTKEMEVGGFGYGFHADADVETTLTFHQQPTI